MVKSTYKTIKKRYKGCKLLKFTDGSVSIYSPHRHKGSYKNRDKTFYIGVHTGGFRKAKQIIDKWKKP